ncbi:DASH family cryptochrome [Motilimonas cestriensis]|uniref:Cryptochrome DASH n=1 Tax=Motilimonas cestriensis TaxID=2742685 RepID=A0ABS8WDT0_9GAMM|nr:DASH family cryptochrome [Motilimonas cestriensis]MCE2595911.1 DASH family cryptochrome [Motilimonas cestriensis]
MTTRGIYFFSNDLRLHDNTLLAQAAGEVDELICLYIDDTLFPSARYRPEPLSTKRNLFKEASLAALESQLANLGQMLWRYQASSLKQVYALISHLEINLAYVSKQVGWFEQQVFHQIATNAPQLNWQVGNNHTLWSEAELPFKLSELPGSFTGFRKKVESLATKAPLIKPSSLPRPMHFQSDKFSLSRQNQVSLGNESFNGGEQAGLTHLAQYFDSNAPSYYKTVRNELDGWESSTKFSPWLANGCLSAKQILTELNTFERHHGANESTYWIYFELLWREYFQWYGHRHQQQLFTFTGIKKQSPLTSFYPERFAKWCQGQTPYPLVNACMKQLNQTGYMSNRGRQIVASCLVNELQIDWRYGARYFEQQLIDYDVASNWGNWQYLAGVGADPRGQRHFDLTKQTQLFDPQGKFIEKWQGQCDLALDSVDAADWPC